MERYARLFEVTVNGSLMQVLVTKEIQPDTELPILAETTWNKGKKMKQAIVFKEETIRDEVFEKYNDKYARAYAGDIAAKMFEQKPELIITPYSHKN